MKEQHKKFEKSKRLLYDEEIDVVVFEKLPANRCTLTSREKSNERAREWADEKDENKSKSEAEVNDDVRCAFECKRMESGGRSGRREDETVSKVSNPRFELFSSGLVRRVRKVLYRNLVFEQSHTRPRTIKERKVCDCVYSDTRKLDRLVLIRAKGPDQSSNRSLEFKVGRALVSCLAVICVGPLGVVNEAKETTSNLKYSTTNRTRPNHKKKRERERDRKTKKN